MLQSNNKLEKAVVLLSGGLDSATTAYIAKSQGYELSAISFNYGQRHLIELEYARKIAEKIGVNEHIIINADLTLIGGSALTDKGIAVPRPKSVEEIGRHVPITYVPARNLIFLSYAAAYAESRKINHVFIGVNVMDYSGYPDCRPEFIESFMKTAELGTNKHWLKVHTPLISMSKPQIRLKAMELGLNIDDTWSCYDPTTDNKPCGRCDSCLLRDMTNIG